MIKFNHGFSLNQWWVMGNNFQNLFNKSDICFSSIRYVPVDLSKARTESESELIIGLHQLLYDLWRIKKSRIIDELYIKQKI